MTVLSSRSRSPLGVLARAGHARSARSGALLMAFAVALSALGVGCGDRTESGSDAEVEPTGLGNEVTMPIAAAMTTVVHHGDEPRSLLRPDIAPGTAQQVTLSTEHHVEQQLNDQPMRDFSPPSVSIPLTARTSQDGIDLTLGAATSPDPTLSQQLLAADGSHAGFQFGELGSVTALRLAPKPATPDTARLALEQAFYQAVYQSITLPKEPVGEGAVWSVHQQVSASTGLLLDQITTATLTKREGKRLTIQLDVKQTPKTQVWKLPNNAGSLDILNYLMHGSGTIDVDLGLPLPVSGSVTLGGHQSYRDPHTKVALRQNISTQVQWGE
ncbi:hypothetical protein NDR87_07485 [Nocardia sp. CDC159]|uniref:Uncharacterized protein n=1 Tax=Nocardia pulmonis TaxID=2951408 RepID=A0A9X2E5Q1_9NOCA|nr:MULTISPECIES: hypothetical protein [Nocardia]MCM6773310.1 hypothetical protein [Nocardia pulmonis]MCM6786197.1 hypothetical protein [Nocardia sp. CDC159]